MKNREKAKELILEQLSKTPIIEAVCQKLEIGRATLYRWKAEDSDFARAADKAIAEGTEVVNDAAEGQLLTGIKNGNLTASIFWLKNKHTGYKQHTLRSGFSIAEDDDENLFIEVFGELKPETKKLIEPYLNKNNNHGKKSQ